MCACAFPRRKVINFHQILNKSVTNKHWIAILDQGCFILFEQFLPSKTLLPMPPTNSIRNTRFRSVWLPGFRNSFSEPAVWVRSLLRVDRAFGDWLQKPNFQDLIYSSIIYKMEDYIIMITNQNWPPVCRSKVKKVNTSVDGVE